MIFIPPAVQGVIAGFGRADMLDTLDTFKNLMVWYAAEKCARDLHPDL